MIFVSCRVLFVQGDILTKHFQLVPKRKQLLTNINRLLSVSRNSLLSAHSPIFFLVQEEGGRGVS